MRRLLVLLLLGPAALACDGPRAQPKPAQPAAAARRATPAAPTAHAAVALRPQPKPGERVRQPELDGYCPADNRTDAYYYHGGSPVVRLAREDGCAPLYITECEPEGQCYPPRDQEPGMWCCAGASEQQATARTR
jgi:hypothetical protein